MTLDWQSIAIFCLSAVIGICGWILRRLIVSVDGFREDLTQLGINLAVTSEWRSEHDKRHLETQQLLFAQRTEMWNAIDKLREK